MTFLGTKASHTMSAPPPGYPTGGKPTETSSSANPDQKGNQPGKILLMQMDVLAALIFVWST